MEKIERPMDEYRAYVQRVATAADAKETILNRTPDHAAVILSVLFSKSEQIVEVVSGNLGDEIWGSEEVQAQAVAFLSRNPDAKIRIVVDSDVDIARNKFLSAIRTSDLMRRVKMFRVQPTTMADYDAEFVVGDGQHYRFQGVRKSFEAIIQFGNLERGQRMRSVFARLRGLGTEVPLS